MASFGKTKLKALPRKLSDGTIVRAGGSHEITLAITGPSTVAAGSPITWTLTRSLGGHAPAPFTVYFRGQDTSVAGNANSLAFSDALGVVLTAAAAADSTNVTYTNFNNSLALTFGVGWSGAIAITRNTVFRTGQGPLNASLGIFNPTLGTVTAPADKIVVIADTAIAIGPAFTQPPSISGDPTIGQILTRLASVVTGVPPPVVTWQWKRNAVVIAGKDNALSINTTGYVADDVITVTDTAVNIEASATSTSSGVTLDAIAPSPPVCTRISTIQGVSPPQVGSALSCADFTWTGSPPPSITRLWRVAGQDISGSSASVYVPFAGDVGLTLVRREIATNGGLSVVADSVATSAVVPAPGGSLTNVTLSSDVIEHRGAEGTFVAGFQPTGGAITSVAFTAGGDAGGVVKLNGTSGLLIGPTSPDFNAGTDANYNLYTIHFQTYNISLLFNGTLNRSYSLRPYFRKIEPRGYLGGTEIDISSLATIRAGLQGAGTTDARIYRFNSSVNTIIQVTESSAAGDVYMARVGAVNPPDRKDNWALVGHRREIMGRAGSLRIRNARNVRIINQAFRPGSDFGVGVDRHNRDSVEINSGSDISFEYCDFSWSIDELESIIGFDTALVTDPNLPPPHRIVFYRCAFYSPMNEAGHDADGESNHPYGPVIAHISSQIWYIECVFLGLQQRNPATGTYNNGLVMRNNLIADYGSPNFQLALLTSNNGNAGIGFGPHWDYDKYNVPARVEGCLFRPPVLSDVNTRRRSIMFYDVTGGVPCVYIAPTTDTYANHYFYGTGEAPNLASDPIDPLTGPFFRRGLSTTPAAVIAPTPRFEYEWDYPPYPTNTVGGRQALLKHLIGRDDCVVGVRTFDNGDPLTGNPVPGWLAMSKVGYDEFSRFGNLGKTRTIRGGYRTPRPAGTYDITYDQLITDGLWDVGLPTTGGNSAPTDITLSNAVIAENSAVATIIGDLTATDADVGDTFTWSILSATPAGLLNIPISSNQLRVAANIDFETVPSIAVTIKVTDSFGNIFSKGFTISVTDVSEGGGVTPPFTDNFNRANASLNASANWTLAAGTASDIGITANQVYTTVNGGAFSTTYLAPDTTSTDHYVQVTYQHTSNNGICLLLRYGSDQGFIQVSRQSGAWAIGVWVAPTATTRTMAGTVAIGDTIRAEVQGAAFTLKKNNSVVGTFNLTGGEVAALTGTFVALHTAGAAVTPAIDNFESGKLGSGGGVTPPGARTAETEAQYTYIKSLTGSNTGYVIRQMQYPTYTNAAQRYEGYPEIIQAITGKFPGGTETWYEDSASISNPSGTPVTPLGVTRSNFLRTEIQARHAAGYMVSLTHNISNPVTGDLRYITTNGGVPGGYDDRSDPNGLGNPVAACLPGGIRRTEFLAYTDRMGAFLNSCVDGSGKKIPIHLRLFGEMNGDWPWYGGADRAVYLKQLWVDMVTRLKTVNGVNNVLFDMCFAHWTGHTINPSLWFTSSATVDLLSIDTYETLGATTAGGPAISTAECNIIRALDPSLPFSFGEYGAAGAGGGPGGASQTDPDIWDVNVGNQMKTTFPYAWSIMYWSQDFGPKASNSVTNPALVRQYADASCITLDRLPGIPLPPPTGRTAETEALYTYIKSLTGSNQKYVIRAIDYQTYTNSSQKFSGYPELMQTIAGKLPGGVEYFYNDPTGFSNPSENLSPVGATRANDLRAKIQASYAAGYIVSLVVAPSNPVTGDLRWISDRLSSPGNYADRNGSPVAACLSGGSKRTEFLAWVDRMGAFLNSCVDGSGKKIPIRIRAFPEINGDWFWWNGSDRATQMKALWSDFVARLRTVSGVNSVLYDMCFAFWSGHTLNPSLWFTSSADIDLLSLDVYELQGATTAIGLTKGATEAAAVHALDTSLPFGFSEYGSAGPNGGPGGASQTDADIWDVNVGNQIKATFPYAWAVMYWSQDYGVKITNTTSNPALVRQFADVNCVTLDRLPSDVYG